jgi:hypothetical protein
MPAIAATYRLDNFKTSQEWYDALLKRINQKYLQQVYWITGTEESLPPINTLLEGWMAVYARPGNNEADVVCMDWIKQPQHRTEPHKVMRLLTIKTESGLAHAIEMANWITLANYSMKEIT